MPRALVAASAASRVVLGLTEKKCHNVYSEPNPNNPDFPVVWIETPGSLQRNKYAAAVRGMWRADGHAGGKILVPHGSTMATYDPATDAAGTLIGTLPGSDYGDAAFAENGAALLFDGKPCFSDGTYIRRATDGVLDDPNLEIGSTKPNVATGAFDYSINGTTYSKGAVAAGTAPGNDVVPTGKYGAVALDIGADGTIDAIEAPANATGYDTASEAVAAFPVPADAHIRIGYVTATKSDGAFTFGTTDLDAANTTVVYTDSAVNTAFTDLLDGETGYTSVAFLGQRFLATVGPRFIFGSVGTSFDLLRTTSAISYYTAESSPDDLIAGRTLAQQYVLFGRETIEFWALTGNADDPMAIQDGLTQQVGCFCRDGIIRADNTLFFIDDKARPRRLGSGGSEILNAEDPWVSELLKAAGAANIRGKTYSDKSHTFVGWRTPSGEVWYDVLTRKWHTRGTNLEDTSRYTHMVEAETRVFVADATGQFDEASRDYTSESMADAETDGTYIVREFDAYLPAQSGRMPIETVKIVCSKGTGTPTGQGSDPVVGMKQSIDGGNTFTAINYKGTGQQGEYSKRAIWRRRGRARDQGVVFRFTKSDPAKHAYLGVVINEDQAA